jgi:S-adenosylmethionine hydrolase
MSDYYLSAVKAACYRLSPETQIVDISHNIQAFNIQQAAYVLNNVMHEFPVGTIHIIGVDGSQDIHKGIFHVVVQYRGQFFIGADNGLFGLLFKEFPEAVYQIPSIEASSFPMLDVFTKVACEIANGKDPAEIGPTKTKLIQAANLMPTLSQDFIRGTVNYIDSYGNIFSNIHATDFKKAQNGRDFEIHFRGDEYPIRQISSLYSDVDENELLALFSSNGYLEIAVNKGVNGNGGGAAKLFGIKIGDTISIEFKNPPSSLSEL